MRLVGALKLILTKEVESKLIPFRYPLRSLRIARMVRVVRSTGPALHTIGAHFTFISLAGSVTGRLPSASAQASTPSAPISLAVSAWSVRARLSTVALRGTSSDHWHHAACRPGLWRADAVSIGWLWHCPGMFGRATQCSSRPQQWCDKLCLVFVFRSRQIFSGLCSVPGIG